MILDIFGGIFTLFLSKKRGKSLKARLAQSVERQPFKLVVEGSSPSSGDFFY